MVTLFRMKFDMIGQALIMSACLLGFIFKHGAGWTNAFLVLLTLWQIVSALHLYYACRYASKINFLRVALVLGASLPLWIFLIGAWAYLPVVGAVVWYFYQTVRDMKIVSRRRRTFWDIG